MVSIEPIMDFDISTMIWWIKEIKPIFVSIGADSKSNKLTEPTPDKIKKLIANLSNFTKVICKNNLRRLLVNE